jgi:hypothetical protein
LQGHIHHPTICYDFAMAELKSDRATAHERSARPFGDSAPKFRSSKPGRLATLALSIYQSDSRLQLALLVFMLVFYGALLWGAWGKSERTVAWNLTFNSMLAHLMQGRFDVDPQIVGWEEGFLRNGLTYSYFGIWPALLRLPLWIFRRMDIDLTLPSCLAAVCVAGFAKVRAVLLVRRKSLPNPIAAWAVGLMLVYVLLGGCGISQLNASIYEEVIQWAYAFASVFVYFAVKGIVNRSFSVGTLCWMALCAGLALNTRVSGGIGLILAFVLLLIALAAFPIADQKLDSTAVRPTATKSFFGALAARYTILPTAILFALIAVSGTVNYFRWGNPATFANWDLYLDWSAWPGSSAWWLSPVLSRIHAYGAFNIVRIPFNLVYYFCPFWVLHATDAETLLNSSLGRTLNGIELPPSSFFLTDLFAFCFIALLAVAVWRCRPRRVSQTARWSVAVGIGLLAPCVLMLTAMWVAYRYRTEFYPEFEFLAILGLYLTVTDSGMLSVFARFRKWITAALVVSFAFSFLALFIADVSLPVPPVLGGRGLVDYYRDVSVQHLHDFMTVHFNSGP